MDQGRRARRRWRHLGLGVATLVISSLGATTPPAHGSAGDLPLAGHAGGPGQRLSTGIERIGAQYLRQRGEGIHVAVIDDGVDRTHSDLKNNIAGGADCSTGRPDTNPPKDLKGGGHGTTVAGVIAAEDNTYGVVGIAPRAKIWDVGIGDGSWKNFLCAVEFVDSKSPARGGRIRVANISFALPNDIKKPDEKGFPPTRLCAARKVPERDPERRENRKLHKAICRAVEHGVTFVVGAGNAARDMRRVVPANYDEVIAVSALADLDGRPCRRNEPVPAEGGTITIHDDTFVHYSNYATHHQERIHLVAAPGLWILTTEPWTPKAEDPGYGFHSGTSLAAPHVAGLAALYFADYPHRDTWNFLRQLNDYGEPAEVNFNGECGPSGVSHSDDPTNLHPEVVVRAEGLLKVGRSAQLISDALWRSPEALGEVFFDRTFRITTSGGSLVLSGAENGLEPLIVDDVLEVTVTRRDNSTETRSFDFSGGCRGTVDPAGPFELNEVISLSGAVSIQIRLMDKCGGGGLGNSPIWMVGDFTPTRRRAT